MYEDDLNNDETPQFAVEFEDDSWVCPDIESITVNNNPSLFTTGNGTSFYLIVNTCAQAIDIDTKYNLTSTHSSNSCLDDVTQFT